MTNAPGQQWRHNWIPLTPGAALIKAKGNRALAAKLRGRHGIRGRDTRKLVRSARQTSVDTTPDRKDVERRARIELRMKSDDQLADDLVAAGDDERSIERIVDELDRRDRAAETKRRRTEAKEAAKEADFDRRVADGEDPEEAYAAAYGLSVERMRRDEAITSLRANGYKGAGFDELTRNAFQDHARQAYLDAEDVTNGYLLNKAGERAGVHPRSLFVGPESRARKYASPELLDYWQERGRMTVDDFKASLIGGSMRSAGTRAFA